MNSCKGLFLRAIGVIQILALSGCYVNTAPNSTEFHMSDADAKAAQWNAMQTKAMDRQSERQDQLLKKDGLRDEAEVRSWEKNITKPSTTVIAPTRSYFP